jgi:hypothetical protein
MVGINAAMAIKTKYPSYEIGLEDRVIDEVKSGRHGDDARENLKDWCPELFG